MFKTRGSQVRTISNILVAELLFKTIVPVPFEIAQGYSRELYIPYINITTVFNNEDHNAIVCGFPIRQW